MPCTKCDVPGGGHGLWALVDCNNFYASCEQLFRPDLRDRPVVVLSNNDGCVVSRSAAAKAAGIPMGEPEFRVRGLLRVQKAAVFSSNYALYGDLSRRVMRILEAFSPRVEEYSIDEAFLRLAGTVDDARAEARALRRRVLDWTGLPVSVGVASTKTLAKLANHAAKLTDGVYCLPTDRNGGSAEARLDEFLAAVPAGEVWGVGRRMAPKLATRGIRSALDLKRADDAWIRRHGSVILWRTVLELRGLPCVDEGNAPVPRRSVLYSRSFGRRVADEASLREAVATFTTRAAEKLRRAGLLTSSLTVHIRTARHGQGPWRDVTRSVTLPAPCADSTVLLKHALACLSALYAPGYAYAKAGVLLSELARRDALQGDLLHLDDQKEEQGRTRLMDALDALNRRYGRDAVRYAAEGPVVAAWHMRRKRCSPAFTTRWDELPVARCR